MNCVKSNWYWVTYRHAIELLNNNYVINRILWGVTPHSGDLKQIFFFIFFLYFNVEEATFIFKKICLEKFSIMKLKKMLKEF